MVVKTGRNDPCVCGSGKKFKKCCIKEVQFEKPTNKYQVGQETKSDVLKLVIDILQETYPDFKILDISDYLDTINYRQYQLNNMRMKTLLVAEKNINNMGVFTDRGPDSCDTIVMYNGAYRVFNGLELRGAIAHIDEMIEQSPYKDTVVG